MRLNNFFKGGRFLLPLIVINGCTPQLPQYKNTPKESIAIPEKFGSQNDSTESDAVQAWNIFFKDENLIELIQIALNGNQELNILTHEISIANNEVMARRGAYFPQVGVSSGYGYEKISELTSQGAANSLTGVPDPAKNIQASFNASWEVDIWKKLRNAAKSSYYEYLSSIEGRNFVVTQLVSEVASKYYELTALDNQLEIITKYIETLEWAQEVAVLQREAGRATLLPVKRFDAEVEKNRAKKQQIKQQIVVTENGLNLLLGRLPQEIKRNSKEFLAMKMPDFKIGLPVDLLDRRPDIKQAKMHLEAMKLNVKSVKSQFYPSLRVDGNYGYATFNSNHFLNTPQTLAYNVAGNITMPLLNRRAIKAEYFSANNKQIQAIYKYEQTFIKAFADVSNQIAYVNNLEKMHSMKEKQVDDLAQSLDISNTLFKAARFDYLESLMTRRDYLESQLDLTEVKLQQILSHVNLYRALGGGWRSDDVPSNKQETKS